MQSYADKDLKQVILHLEEMTRSGAFGLEQGEALAKTVNGVRKAYRSGDRKAMLQAAAKLAQMFLHAHNP